MATKFLDYAGLEHIIGKLKNRQFNGQGLSKEDFTTELKTQLTALQEKLGSFDPSSVATDSNLAALQTKVDGIVAIINSEGTADGDKIINKLNEVFAFLAEVSSDEKLSAILAGKVDKVEGKGLSANDYTDADKAAVGTIADKVDKVEGKGLSANDYTDAEKAEVAKIATIESTLGDKLNSADIVAVTTAEIDAMISA